MPKTDLMRAAALDAIMRGYQPIPIREHLKRPLMGNWPHIVWDKDAPDIADQWDAKIAEWGFGPGEPYNLGVILGPSSGHLVDVDIDDPKAKRFRDFLPRTKARGGRPGSPDSHYWYIVEDDASGLPTPSTRRYKLADQITVTIEFRYDRGVQTVMPPSDWVPKDWESTGSPANLVEIRDWSREPWGGPEGPAHISGRKLALQVALIALCTILLDNWPTAGTRHEAYLSLAGALMRQADGVVHPFWGQYASLIVRALADASNDDDGADARETETIPSTIKNIRDGKQIWGFPHLASIIGNDQVSAAMTLVAEIEQLAGFVSRQAGAPPTPPAPPVAPATTTPPAVDSGDSGATVAAPSDSEGVGADGAPMEPEEILGSWGAIDLEPYLSGLFKPVEPTVLRRDDGRALFYPGRLNMLFAPSESGKTLVALHTSLEVIASGERVVFIDFEDEPVNTIERLRAMGAADDDLRLQFNYVRPDGPIAPMQRDNWGNDRPTDVGASNAVLFSRLLEQVDPALIIADGMTSIYGLHGLDSNNSVETDVITTWLKSLSRNGRTTVIIIDHMAKSGEKGSMPIGSQHKVSMVQGTLLQVWPIDQPRKGGHGKVELIVLKDRPGQVRQFAGRLNGKAQLAATVKFDSTGKWPDGSPSTLVTLESPPLGAGATVPQGPPVLVVDLSQVARDKKADEARKKEEMILGAFGGKVGTRLTWNEVLIKIDARWRANKWSVTSRNLTREALVTQGILDQVGGRAGPNVAYVLQNDPALYNVD
jgi:hypothetical protein